MHQDKRTRSQSCDNDGDLGSPRKRIQDHLTIRLNMGTEPLEHTQTEHTLAPTTGRDKVTISRLPDDILSQIFTHLDFEPPSQIKAQQRPTVYYTSSIFIHLKSVAQVSHRWRRLSTPLLFRHCHLDIDELSMFLSFVRRSSLCRIITTITILYQDSDPPPSWWDDLLAAIPVVRLTIHAEPKAFTDLVGVEVSTKYDWAFDMPYHTLTLQQSAQSAEQPITYNGAPPNLLICKPWHTITFNEGSSIAAYSADEAAKEITPSLLTALYKRKTSRLSSNHRSPSSRRPENEKLDVFLDSVESFHYIAILPYSTHVTKIFEYSRQMKKLRRLYVKLCPDLLHEIPETSQEIQTAKTLNYVDVIWEELDRSYAAIGRLVERLYMEGSLLWFRTGDAGFVGTNNELMDDQLMQSTVMNNLLGQFEHLHGFRYEGDGIWRKAYA